MLEINNPNLYLFSYHLKESLASSHQDYYAALEKLVSYLSPSNAGVIALEPRETFLALNTNPTADLNFKGTLNNHTIKGRYLRRILNDSYALIFDGSVQERYNTHQIQSLLISLKSLTPEPFSPQNLGQTWLLSGVVEDGTLTQIERLAEESYKTLISPEGWHYRETGDYLGVKLYEFWRASEDKKWENIQANSHLLLVLYPDRETFKAGWGFYQQWQQVLWGRHQIIRAYHNSQLLITQLMEGYQQVEAIADYSGLSLYRLKTIMDSLGEVISQFNALEMNLHLIETTVARYDKYCHQLEHDADGLGLTDLKLLKNFSQGVKEIYLPQIQAEINQFRLKLERVEDLTQTLGSLVEIRQAQRDRTLKTALGIVGVGLGTGCIVAVASSNHLPGMNKFPLVNSGTGSGLPGLLLFSVICGGVASLVTFLAVALWQKVGK